MELKRTWGLAACCLTMAMSLTVAGCGGGGGGTAAIDDGSNARVVDPYIKGAKFIEKQEKTGKQLQVSEESGADGKFKFNKTLTVGSTLEMLDQGVHGKVPFDGKLKYKVTAKAKRAAEQNDIIITPLTTLLSDQIDIALAANTSLSLDAAETAAETQVVNFVQAVTGDATFSSAGLAKDPMAQVLDGTVNTSDAQLLAVNMAVNTAIQVLGTIDLSDSAAAATAQGVVDAVADKLAVTFETEGATGGIDTAAEAAISITSYITENNITDATQIGTVTDLADEVIAALDAATSPDSVVVITNPTTVTTVADMNALAQQYYDEGVAAYQAASVSGIVSEFKLAVSKFLAAAALKNSITDPALKDKVLFFGAFASVMQVADPTSDNTVNGLNNFGDLLDAFGLVGSPAAAVGGRDNLNTLDLNTCGTFGTAPYQWYDCSLLLSDTAPTATELQSFAYDKVAQQLQAAVSMLESVSSSFGTSIDDAGVIVEFDQTDALAVKAMANAMLAQLNFIQAYNFDNVNLYAEQNAPDTRTPDQFFTQYPNLGKLQSAARMADFKTYTNAAIAALETAVAAVQAETDSGTGQANDFVTFSQTSCDMYGCVTTYNDPAKVTEFNAGIAEVKSAMASTASSPYAVKGDEDGDGVNEFTYAKVNLAPFFAGVDLRAKMPTTWNAGAFGENMGPLPDPSFGGILQQIASEQTGLLLSPSYLNTDSDGDGAPDIFDGMTYLKSGMFAGKSYQVFMDDMNGAQQWHIDFASSGTGFTGNVSVWNGMLYLNSDISGSYSVSNSTLTLTIATSTDPGFTTTKLVGTLQSSYRPYDGLEMKIDTYNGTMITNTYYRWFEQQMMMP